MGARRGVDERRGSMRELQREARREHQEREQHDSGGQEHASRAEREGIPARRPPVRPGGPEE
jgi:hypothetical protein